MIRYCSIIALLIVSAGSVASAEARRPTLKVGDAAPVLAVGEWVKGEPVEQFEDGKLYVVEFWATWCGPCKAIMPHLSELAVKNPDVKVISVNVSEPDESKVKPFVARMGDKMNYRVALDDKSKTPDGAMAKTWLQAAGQDGIPAAFLIGRDKKVLWIGHPSALDGVLAKAKTGGIDAKVAAGDDAKAEKLNDQAMAAFKASDPDGFIKVCKEIRVLKPEDATMMDALECELLCKADRADDARVRARAVLDAAKDPQMLNKVAFGMATLGKPTADDLKLAREACDKAFKLTGQPDPNMLDTSARIYAVQGDWDNAIDTQKKAIALENHEGPFRQQLQATLAAYEKRTMPPSDVKTPAKAVA